MSSVRYESNPSSIAPSRPCVSGSGPRPRDQLLAHARGEELREAAVAVRDPERGVPARARDRARRRRGAAAPARSRGSTPTASTASLISRSAGLNRSGISFRGYVSAGNDAGRLIGSRAGPRCASQSSRIFTATGTPSRRCSPTSRKRASTRSGASATSSATGRSRTAASRWRGSARDLCLLGQPRPGGDRRGRPLDLLARRGDERALDDRRARARRRPTYLKTLEPKGERDGVELFHAQPARPDLGVRAQRAGRAHRLELTTAHARARRATATSRSRSGSRTATRSRAGSRRAAARSSSTRDAGCSTPARSASRATATRAPRTCCSSSTAATATGRRTSSACPTTSGDPGGDPQGRAARRARRAARVRRVDRRTGGRRNIPPCPFARSPSSHATTASRPTGSSTRRSTAAATAGCSPTCRRSRPTRRCCT